MRDPQARNDTGFIPDSVVVGNFTDPVRAGDTDQFMEDVAMDSKEWWGPTTVAEEAANGGQLRATAPYRDSGPELDIQLIGGTAETSDESVTGTGT